MTKRFLSALAILSIAAMMMLSSCTAAGVECGLIGTWENEGGGVKTTVEITNDDKVIITGKGLINSRNEFSIKSVEAKEIICTYDGGEYKIKYSDLGCDTVKFNGDTFKKVY
ncbi:MAG: hypothetical protein UHW86_09130 [Spirochaetota bacterium]|nr:hypothetical protein [Spirochaetota bacterium]